MNTGAEIEMQVQRMLAQSGELLAQGQKVRSLREEQLSAILDEVSDAWTGESAGAFLRQGASLKKRMLRLEYTLKQTALLLAKTAETMRETEKKAAGTAGCG